MEESREVAATVDNALDSYDLIDHPKEYDVLANNRNAGTLADLWPELTMKRSFADFSKLFTQFAEERYCPRGIILSDVVCDDFEIGFDKAR